MARPIPLAPPVTIATLFSSISASWAADHDAAAGSGQRRAYFVLSSCPDLIRASIPETLAPHTTVTEWIAGSSPAMTMGRGSASACRDRIWLR
jgi:hypothetical protein